MADLYVDGDELVLHMRALEKAEGVHGDIRVPFSAVTAVRSVDDAWPELRGLRAPGTGVPNVIAVGTRRGSFGKDFAAVHGKGPAVVVELDGRRVQRLVVTADDAAARARAIAQAEASAGADPTLGSGSAVSVGPGRLEADGAGHVALGHEADDALPLEHGQRGPAGAGT